MIELPKDETKIDITNEVFKEPLEVIKQLTTHMDGLKYTKVIQTFVMEDRRLNFQLEGKDSTYLKGKIVWIGNKKDGSDGTVFCVDSKSEYKQINPNTENTEQVILDLKKELIRITTGSKSSCAVCGKPIEIFDEVAACPICDTKAHKDHMIDWIKMKHTCPVCKKSLSVSGTGQIFID